MIGRSQGGQFFVNLVATLDETPVDKIVISKDKTIRIYTGDSYIELGKIRKASAEFLEVRDLDKLGKLLQGIA